MFGQLALFGQQGNDFEETCNDVFLISTGQLFTLSPISDSVGAEKPMLPGLEKIKKRFQGVLIIPEYSFKREKGVDE